MMDKIKFAVIGCGYIGQKHIHLIQKNQNCELCGVFDIRDNQEWNFDKNLNSIIFSSYEEMLAQCQANAIVIATPNGYHAKHALQAIDAFKHVIIEKPMALNTEDARHINGAAFEANKKVFVVMQNRFSAVSVWLKNLVSTNKLGKLYLVQLNCFWNRDDRYYTPNSWHGNLDLDGGVLFTQFSHYIDVLFWLFGTIKNVRSKIKLYSHPNLPGFDDNGFSHFEFINGGIGNISYSTSTWDKNMETSLSIISEKGSIKISGQYMEKIEYCHLKEYNMMEDILYVNALKTEKIDNHEYVIQNVVDVLHHEAEISTSGIEAMHSVEIIEQIYNAV